MARTAQIRFDDEMDDDVLAIRRYITMHAIGSTTTDAVRLALRQARRRLDAGLALVDDALPEPDPNAPSLADACVELRPPRRPWTAKEEKRLGKASDKEVAEELGREAEAVSIHRRRLGIARYAPTKPKAAKAAKK